jgi:acyl-CoA thioester hydrolase
MHNHSKPIVFRSSHKPRFFEIDPYGHLSMVHYAAYFVEHRFQGMAQHCGLNAQVLADLEVAIYCSNLKIDFKRPVLLDTEFTIESHIASYSGSSAVISCSMYDQNGKLLASCQMDVVCIDHQRGKPKRWPDTVIGRFFVDSVAAHAGHVGNESVAYSA